MAKKSINDNKKNNLKNLITNNKTHVADGVLNYIEGATVQDIASAMEKPSSQIIQYFFMKKIPLTPNSPLTEELIGELALENDLDFKKLKQVDETNVLTEYIENSKKGDLPDKRPPVITIMGHVDHGKTSLLDAIRKANVAAGEAGGITQSIGAYQIEYNKEKMTFIDTPGHEAFTEMRARGSKITDIIIIVVAADDSVMPQTKESIDHAKAAGIPIIVAINKIDSPKADIEKVKTDMANHGLMSEDWGGETPTVEISAKMGTGIDKLLETIILIGEMEDYKTKNDAPAAGVVVETQMEKGRGNVITVLVQYGTLLKGDTLILDTEMANVRVMYNDMNVEVESAQTSTPVKITGFPTAPELGSRFVSVHDVKEAKKIVKARQDAKKESKFNNQLSMKMEDFLKKQDGNDQKQLSVILVADSKGSIEAVTQQVKTLTNEKVKVKVIRQEMGQISKADVLLSSANDAPIYTFNVKVNQTTKDLIEKHKVRLFSYDVIYHLLEDMQKHMLGLQDTEYKTIEIGKAQVKKIFTFSKVGQIAGSSLTAGKVTNKANVRVLREGEIVFDGKLSSLRIEKDTVREVTGVGKEFAFTIEKFDELQEGDFVEFYELEEITYD